MAPDSPILAAPAPPISVDPARLDVGPEGLASFWWPLAQGELFGFRDALHGRLAALAREAKTADGRLLRIVMPGLLYRAMGLFEAAVVAERSAAAGVTLEPPRGGTSLAPLLCGEVPHDHPSDPRRRLVRPFPPEPLWRGAARVVRNRLSGGEIPRRRLFEIDPRRGVVTLALNRSIARAAEVESDPVVYCHPRDWFPLKPAGPAVMEVEEADGEPGESGGRALRAAVLESIGESAATYGVALSRPVLRHLEGYLESITALADRHLKRLLARPRRLPRRLWLVSGVTPWARVLITAVQIDGGEATGFEHGTGESWAAVCGDTQFEFDMLDRFTCYTVATARASAAQQAAVPQARATACAIAALPDGAGAPVPVRRALPARPRVMQVSTLYRCDRHMRYKAPLADPVAVDWQARLFGRLGQWGYEALFRPHPDQREPVPDFAGLGAPRADGLFSEVLEAADIVLFDLPLTSAWRDALLAGKPVVLVDFGQSSLSAEALALAERRMAIVPAGFGPDNRAQLDWEALRAALESAPALADPGFTETYFGHG